MVGQGGRGGWSGVHRGSTVPQLPSVKGAANCGASGQAASVRRRGGGGSTSPRDAQCGRRCCRHAMTQGAAGQGGREGGEFTFSEPSHLHYYDLGHSHLLFLVVVMPLLPDGYTFKCK